MAITKPFQIAIIGGGIAGATMAIGLLKRNIRCQIYDQGHGFSEIGAGVSFSPNAVHAMDHCDQSIRAAFEAVVTRNQWPAKEKVYFDILDGTKTCNQTLDSLTNEFGQSAVHRADFMDELARLVPRGISHFRKRLDRIDEDPLTGRLRILFLDGTTAEADAVVGADGIKSRTRQMVVGADHPSALPQYSHVYAYRGVVPMEKAIEVLGAERAQNSSLWMGPGSHVLTYSVNHGMTFNLFAAVFDSDDWPNPHKLTAPAKKEDALRCYSAFGPTAKEAISLVSDNLEKWALFDTGDHPVPHFNKGRILVMGDAAHATTPHHGAGAGLCIEDAATLVALLADERVQSHDDLEAAFATFDAVRRPRTQWVVQSSRRMCELYQCRTRDVGTDIGRAIEEMRQRWSLIWDFDTARSIIAARLDLGDRIEARRLRAEAGRTGGYRGHLLPGTPSKGPGCLYLRPRRDDMAATSVP